MTEEVSAQVRPEPDAVDVLLHNDDERRLHTVMWGYHDAVQRREGIEARLRRGDNDRDLTARGLVAAQAVIRARLALHQELRRQGWTPPASVQRSMESDAALVRESAHSEA